MVVVWSSAGLRYPRVLCSRVPLYQAMYFTIVGQAAARMGQMMNSLSPRDVSGLDRRDFLHHRRRTGRWVDTVEIRNYVGADVALVLGLRVLQNVG